jgi:hypothetical protein
MNGSGLNSIASTALKMAVFAPIPSGSAASAMPKEPGFLLICRKVYFRCARRFMTLETSPGTKCSGYREPIGANACSFLQIWVCWLNSPLGTLAASLV